MKKLLGLLPLSAIATALAMACSTPPSNARIGVATPPEGDDWKPVHKLLDYRCGSLDCHGNAQRNMVLWGCAGLRADPTMYPNCTVPTEATTEDERDRSFRSLVGLEPAVMTAVVRGNGADPEMLTFLRKARGMDAHKGGQLFTPGDLQDRCVTSWLAGQTDANACACASKAVGDSTARCADAGAP